MVSFRFTFIGNVGARLRVMRRDSNRTMIMLTLDSRYDYHSHSPMLLFDPNSNPNISHFRFSIR